MLLAALVMLAPNCTRRVRALGKESVNRFGLKEGDKALVWGLLA